MRARLVVLVLAGALGLPAQAGHGFLNAFAGIEWLPPPGRTPDRFGYAVVGLTERARLVLAADDERLPLCLELARLKLAETDAMVRAGKRAAAEVAVAAYVGYIDRAAQEVAAGPAARRANAAETMAQALLEHQYIMSVNYLDMPRAARTVIGAIVEAAAAHYDELAAALPPAFKAAQFFKEEEVRWSWEMAQQADAQGL